MYNLKTQSIPINLLNPYPLIIYSIQIQHCIGNLNQVLIMGTTTTLLLCDLSFLSKSKIMCLLSKSKEPVGSSHSTKSQGFSKSLAIAILCCSQPEH